MQKRKVCSRRQSALRPDRLFVPLASTPFSWFANGSKNWELRRYGRAYTDKHIYPGRAVELRRGYSGKDSIWGTIESVVVAPTLDEIFTKINFRQIIPPALDEMQAARQAGEILGIEPGEAVQMIAFKVRKRGN